MQSWRLTYKKHGKVNNSAQSRSKKLPIIQRYIYAKAQSGATVVVPKYVAINSRSIKPINIITATMFIILTHTVTVESMKANEIT